MLELSVTSCSYCRSTISLEKKSVPAASRITKSKRFWQP